jgi:hypothetical protein
MKKTLVFMLTWLCLCGMSQLVSARVPPPYGYHHRPAPVSRMGARRVLDKTRGYLYRAQNVAPPYGPNRYRLRQAFNYQKRARRLLAQCFYHSAVRTSLRAREIAKDIIATRRRPPLPPPAPRRRWKPDGSISIHLTL